MSYRVRALVMSWRETVPQLVPRPAVLRIDGVLDVIQAEVLARHPVWAARIPVQWAARKRCAECGGVRTDFLGEGARSAFCTPCRADLRREDSKLRMRRGRALRLAARDDG